MNSFAIIFVAAFTGAQARGFLQEHSYGEPVLYHDDGYRREVPYDGPDAEFVRAVVNPRPVLDSPPLVKEVYVARVPPVVHRPILKERRYVEVPDYDDHGYGGFDRVVDHDVQYVDGGYDLDIDYGSSGSGHRFVETARPRRIIRRRPLPGARRILRGVSGHSGY